MAKPNSPKEFLDYAKSLGKNTQQNSGEVDSCLSNVEEIIKGLEKGLQILKDNGRKPDPKVLQNYEYLKEAKQLLQKYV